MVNKAILQINYYWILIYTFTWTGVLFHWGFSDRKSPQLSRTARSILAYFNCSVIWSLYSSSNLQTLNQASEVRPRGTYCNWYHNHPHVLHLFRWWLMRYFLMAERYFLYFKDVYAFRFVTQILVCAHTIY